MRGAVRGMAAEAASSDHVTLTAVFYRRLHRLMPVDRYVIPCFTQPLLIVAALIAWAAVDSTVDYNVVHTFDK